MPFSRSRLAPHSAFWRKVAYAGARHGPRFWVRYSPPVFGLMFGLMLSQQRRAVLRNLRWLSGKRNPWSERLDVARTFANYASCLAESLAAGRPEAVRAQHRLVGAEHFDNALRGNRGAVLLTAHVGPWDAAGQALVKVAAHRPVLVVMRREANAAALRFHDDIRARAGVRVVHVGGHPLDALPVLHHLQEGGICAIQLDRVPPGAQCLEVDMAGRRFLVPKGPFFLAAMAEVPILPLFARRLGYFEYELSAFEPLNLSRHASSQELQQAAQRTADTLAGFLERNPTQWFNFELGPSEGTEEPSTPTL